MEWYKNEIQSRYCEQAQRLGIRDWGWNQRIWCRQVCVHARLLLAIPSQLNRLEQLWRLNKVLSNWFRIKLCLEGVLCCYYDWLCKCCRNPAKGNTVGLEWEPQPLWRGDPSKGSDVMSMQTRQPFAQTARMGEWEDVLKLSISGSFCFPWCFSHEGGSRPAEATGVRHLLVFLSLYGPRTAGPYCNPPRVISSLGRHKDISTINFWCCPVLWLLDWHLGS